MLICIFDCLHNCNEVYNIVVFIILKITVNEFNEASLKKMSKRKKKLKNKKRKKETKQKGLITKNFKNCIKEAKIS